LQLLKSNHLQPGDKTSIDQYLSTVPGQIEHTKGKELKKDKYVGGTIFVDHASSFIYVHNQVTLRSGDTLCSKIKFESFASSCGVRLSFRADNFPFASQEITEHLLACGQEIDYSGFGAHHQNGIAERDIRTITEWSRSMMLHAILHWPETTNLELWPFAMNHAAYLWNKMPQKDTLLSPMEIFAGAKSPSGMLLQRTHVWGCSCYVLDPKLQDGRKIPKWTPRARCGQFLGFSPQHSSMVGRILNLDSGAVSPQFHVVYDDLFSMVPMDDSFDGSPFSESIWKQLVVSGLERCIFDDENDSRLSLAEEWLTKDELNQNNADTNQQRHKTDFPWIELPDPS